MANKTLFEHRLELINNPLCWEQHFESARKNLANKIWDWVRLNNPKAKKVVKFPFILEMADLIFEHQDKRPFFHIGDDMITAWNSPRDWDKNYIIYQIGHMNPINNGGESNPENLCYMSARCNQHIQSSLPMDEVLAIYFNSNSIAKKVVDKYNNLLKLHQSEKWLELKKQILE